MTTDFEVKVEKNRTGSRSVYYARRAGSERQGWLRVPRDRYRALCKAGAAVLPQGS